MQLVIPLFSISDKVDLQRGSCITQRAGLRRLRGRGCLVGWRADRTLEAEVRIDQLTGG